LQASELFERCIGVELQAKQVYAAFAKTFAGTKSAQQFFEVLAQHEQDQADLLKVCWDWVGESLEIPGKN
jgi:rubrerythrin